MSKTEPEYYVDPYPGMTNAQKVTVPCPHLTGGVRFSAEKGCHRCHGTDEVLITVASARNRARQAAIKRIAPTATERRQIHYQRLLPKFPLLKVMVDLKRNTHAHARAWLSYEVQNLYTILESRMPTEHELLQALGRLQRGEEEALEAENSIEAPTGLQEITGVIRNVKMTYPMVRNIERPTLKMAVRDDRHFTVWVTVPQNIRTGEVTESGLIGERITFQATLSPSYNDPTFCFGKNPRKASLRADQD